MITEIRKKRLEAQGYCEFTLRELDDFKFGIRFAYYLCDSIVILGLLLASKEILTAMMIIAFFGTFPPYHPFDYLYNYGIRHLIGKPKMPPRSNQGRFACGIASVWLGGTIYLLHLDLNLWAYIAGASLVAVATLVSTLDICIPSMIYNFFFKKSSS